MVKEEISEKEEEFVEKKTAVLKKKRKLQDSCKRAKVRTYACESDGFRTVKYFNYEFDFVINYIYPHEVSAARMGKPATSVHVHVRPLETD